MTDEPVRYDVPASPEPPTPLPDYLRRFLSNVLHLPAEAVAAMPRDEAQSLLNQYYSRELRDP